MRSQGSRVLELHFQNRPTIPISHAAPRLGRPDEHATPTSHLTRASRIAHVKQTTHAKFGFHDAKTSRQNPQDHDWQKRVSMALNRGSSWIRGPPGDLLPGARHVVARNGWLDRQ